jgi:hypothetical protein
MLPIGPPLPPGPLLPPIHLDGFIILPMSMAKAIPTLPIMALPRIRANVRRKIIRLLMCFPLQAAWLQVSGQAGVPAGDCATSKRTGGPRPRRASRLLATWVSSSSVKSPQCSLPPRRVFITINQLRNYPVMVEAKPSEGQELLFLIPFIIPQVKFHYGGMG